MTKYVKIYEKAKGNCRLTNKVVTNLLHGAPPEVEGRVVGLKELVTYFENSKDLRLFPL